MSVLATFCPYCREPLLRAQDARCCQVCGTCQHDACWQEYNRCSVYGCPGKVAPVLKHHNIWKLLPALLLLVASRDHYAFATFSSFYLMGSLFCISQAIRSVSVLTRRNQVSVSTRDDLIAALYVLLNTAPIVLLVRGLILFFER